MLRRLRVPRWLALTLVGAFALLAAGAALATDGGDVVEECYEQAGGVPQAGIRACRAAQGFVFQTGRACRMATTPENCEMVDGRFINPDLVDTYEGSWVPRALALQRDIDDEVALKRELWVHTHNSFNAEAYLPTLSGLDPNQIYSITDQMRMGVRAIEIDVH